MQGVIETEASKLMRRAVTKLLDLMLVSKVESWRLSRHKVGLAEEKESAQAGSVLPDDVEVFVSTIEEYVRKGDGGADEKDTLQLVAIIREQAASERAAIKELGNIVASVAKELDSRDCDPNGNEPVWLPVRRMRDRLAKLEASLSEACDEWEYASQYKGEFLAEKHGDASAIAELRELLKGSANGETSKI